LKKTLVLIRVQSSLGETSQLGVFAFLGQLYLALGANPLSHLFGSSFLGNQVIIRVFRALDWLSSISGVKIMAKKIEIGKNATPTNANPGCITPVAITRRQVELESCSNPLKMRKVL